MTLADMFAFEARPWRHAGAKEQAIAAEFDLTPTRYYQQLVRVLDDPASLEVDATTVRRLQRAQAARATVRHRARWAS